MSAYRPYPKNKPSGVEWLGDVPEGWEVKQARHLGIFSGSGIDKKFVEGELPVKMFNYLDVYKSIDKKLVYRPDLMDTTAPPEKVRDHSVQKGDLLFTPSSETADDVGHAARVMEVPAGVVYSYHVLRFRQTKLSDSAFLTYFFNSKTLRAYFASICTGTTRMVLSRDDFNCAPVALPPLPEQHQIATFLDRECGKLDALQAKQQRLIELLKEKRQALISHAVTKGLNPNAKLKNSGIEWLGDVPEHWVVSRVKFVLVNEDRRRVPLSSEERSFKQGEYPYYGASGIIDSVDEFIFNGDRILVGEDGANLVNRATPLAFVASGKYWVNNHAHILRAPDDLSAFWAQLIETNDISPIVSGSAQPKLTSENLANLPIWFPPSRDEREKIVAHLDEKCGKIDQLKAKAERGIELLKERRSALISAAVTGKIDVRDV